MSLLDKKLSRTKTTRALGSKPHTKRSTVIVPKSLTWDLLRKCRHDLKNSGSCAMCKLVQRSTDTFLEEERRQNLAIKTEGFMKRAEMRLSLLDMWWRNQMYHYYETLPMITGEITLNAGVAEALENCSVEDIYDLQKFLQKRARILEVGYYAAVTIQRIVRGYISRHKTIEYLLLRFEYIHPTKKTEAYYVDRETNEIWDWPPLLIDHCRPASPRTLQRRLNTIAKQKEHRARQYQRTSTTSTTSLWHQAEQKAIYARQLVILRDVLLCVMRCITSRRKEAGERPPAAKSSTDRSAQFFPVWFTMSNPAPVSRQIYLSLLLDTPPLEPESEEAVADVDEEKEEFTLNDRCKILENKLFEIMKCESPEDILAKLKCEELSPALSSVSQIADDEYNIWNGRYVTTSSASYDSYDKPADASPDVSNSADTCAHHIPNKSLLPIQLQLHPYYSNRSAMGLFRLVFVDNQLFLVTQVSTWAFYSEAWKLRNGIVKAIQSYADDPTTKQMLQHIQQQTTITTTVDAISAMPSTARSITSNAAPIPTARSTANPAAGSTPTISPMPSLQQSSSIKPSPPPSCIAVVVPDADDIYGLPTKITTSATTSESSLAPSEFSKAESRYEFIKKMSIWKQHKKTAKRNKEHIKSLVVVDDGVGDVEPKITAMPPSEHLLGTNIFKYTFQDVPESSIPLANLHLAENLGSGAYSALLRKWINSSDSIMKKRINYPTQELPPGQPRLLEPPTQLNYDLTVIEVHVTFPTKEAKDTSKDGSNAPTKTKTLPPLEGSNKWKVELHQIVGVFSSEVERCPAGLDLGHFSWEKMKDLLADKRRSEAAAVADAAVPPLPSNAPSSIPTLQKQHSAGESSQWVSIGNQTGVSKLRTMSYSNVNHFRMLSKPPTREYIEKNVPRKIRMWLGMKF